MTPHFAIDTYWIALAGLTCLSVLMLTRPRRVPAKIIIGTQPTDAHDILRARVGKLERLIAANQRQLARTEELASRLDRAA